jgi:hypothetical protein
VCSFADFKAMIHVFVSVLGGGLLKRLTVQDLRKYATEKLVKLTLPTPSKDFGAQGFANLYSSGCFCLLKSTARTVQNGSELFWALFQGICLSFGR